MVHYGPAEGSETMTQRKPPGTSWESWLDAEMRAGQGEGSDTMRQHKPPGASWKSWIDAQIRVAQEQGAFDNLPGAGKPLPNIDQEYDPMWWVKQLVPREQVSVLSPSLVLLRTVA